MFLKRRLVWLLVFFALAGIAFVFFAILPLFSNFTLPSLSGATGWINSKPLSWSDFSSQPVVLYFWSSTCERCLEGLQLADSWSDISGLRVVLIHSPEFAFERSNESAAFWVEKLRIRQAVALDHSSLLWSGFSSNNTKDIVYVIDRSGRVVYSASRAVFAHSDALQSFVASGAADWPKVAIEYPTRAYLGSSTPSAARQGWFAFRSADYVLPRELEAFVPYLVGRWYVGVNFVRAEAGGQVVMRLLNVSNLSVVASSPAGFVNVFWQGRPLPQGWRGADVLERDGLSVFLPVVPALYRVRSGAPTDFELLLDVPAGFVLYRFTVE